MENKITADMPLYNIPFLSSHNTMILDRQVFGTIGYESLNKCLDCLPYSPVCIELDISYSNNFTPALDDAINGNDSQKMTSTNPIKKNSFFPKKIRRRGIELTYDQYNTNNIFVDHRATNFINGTGQVKIIKRENLDFLKIYSICEVFKRIKEYIDTLISETHLLIFPLIINIDTSHLKTDKIRIRVLEFIEYKFREIFKGYCFEKSPRNIIMNAAAAEINGSQKVVASAPSMNQNTKNYTEEETHNLNEVWVGGGHPQKKSSISEVENAKRDTHKQEILAKTLEELMNKVLIRAGDDFGDVFKYRNSSEGVYYDSATDDRLKDLSVGIKNMLHITRIYPSGKSSCFKLTDVAALSRPTRKISYNANTTKSAHNTRLGIRESPPQPTSAKCTKLNEDIFETFIVNYTKNPYNINCVAVNIHDLPEEKFQKLKELFEKKFESVLTELYSRSHLNNLNDEEEEEEVGASGGGRIKKKTKRRRVLNRNRTIKRNQLIKKGGSIKKRKLLKSKKRRKRLTKKRI